MSLTISAVFFVVAAILFVIDTVRSGSLVSAGLACLAVGLALV